LGATLHLDRSGGMLFWPADPMEGIIQAHPLGPLRSGDIDRASRHYPSGMVIRGQLDLAIGAVGRSDLACDP
jgi:hypothetical protein